MKVHSRKIAVLFAILLLTTSLLAQDKKGKTAMSRDVDKEVLEKKGKRIDSLGQETQVPVKKHASDLVEPAKEERTGKQKREVPGKPNPWQNVRSKKIVMNVPCKPYARISLQNIMHKINILTTDGNKVMIVANVEFQGTSSLTDTEWFSKLKLSIGGDENNIEIKSGYSATGDNSGPKLDTIFNGVTLFDSLGAATARRTRSDHPILLYIPKGSQLNVESKYADITFEDEMDSVDARITNGQLDLMKVVSLRATGTYARINAQNIQFADINVVNGSLKAKRIDTLTIASKNSSVAINKVDRLTIADSQADRFQIEEAGTIIGQKAYGDLTVSSLNGSVDVEGVNADVKIKRIKPSASAIKLNTQYAVLQLPVSELKNYEVHFEGTGGKVTSPFAKANATQTSFHTRIGSGTTTSFLLKCNNCTVDFN